MKRLSLRFSDLLPPIRDAKIDIFAVESLPDPRTLPTEIGAASQSSASFPPQAKVSRLGRSHAPKPARDAPLNSSKLKRSRGDNLPTRRADEAAVAMALRRLRCPHVLRALDGRLLLLSLLSTEEPGGDSGCDWRSMSVKRLEGMISTRLWSRNWVDCLVLSR